LGLHPFIDYEVERSFVWQGFEDAKLSIRGLSESELRDQLDLVAKRGYRDTILVEMAIEIKDK
jgi:hypothetical protein